MNVITRLYQHSDRRAFIDLNLDWIEESFSVEQSDLDQLERPEKTILGVGGQIIVAELNGEVVGTGAILPPHHHPADDRKWLEIVKMSARKNIRGKGIGRAILEALIKQAREMQANAIWLETNSDLTAAIGLYEKCGFQHLTQVELWPTPYARCNVQMMLQL